MAKRIVIALGGNALGKNAAEQLALVKKTAAVVAEQIALGHQVVLTHGNGPQVGMIQLGLSAAAQSGAIAADMPFPECGAMSQGYIGYHLQQSIAAALKARNIERTVATIVTQTLVDRSDPAFSNPTKPVGAFYDEATARRLAEERHITVAEDAGRGWRQVVPSPRPVGIVELPAIRTLLDAGHVVIAVGGGGVPVVKTDEGWQGVDAVIDKDLGGALLADLLDADELVILTAVERAALYFGKPNQQWLDHITVQEALMYAEQGHFAKGSMLPKIRAAAQFAASAPGRRALITSLERAADGIAGKTGTRIEG